MQPAKPTVEVRTPRLNSVLRQLIVADHGAYGALKQVDQGAHADARPPGRCCTRSENASSSPSLEPPDEVFMAELRRRLKPEVVALSEYLDRDLVSLWGYDELS